MLDPSWKELLINTQTLFGVLVSLAFPSSSSLPSAARAALRLAALSKGHSMMAPTQNPKMAVTIFHGE